MLQIMWALASYTDVPEADLKEGRALPSTPSTNNAENNAPVRIKCSKGKPADAFAAVHYRGQWFWVDDRDWRTKRALHRHHVFVHHGGKHRGREIALDHHTRAMKPRRAGAAAEQIHPSVANKPNKPANRPAHK